MHAWSIHQFLPIECFYIVKAGKYCTRRVLHSLSINFSLGKYNPCLISWILRKRLAIDWAFPCRQLELLFALVILLQTLLNKAGANLGETTSLVTLSVYYLVFWSAGSDSFSGSDLTPVDSMMCYIPTLLRQRFYSSCVHCMLIFNFLQFTV